MKNIVLTGFMGAGKTVVGKRLAEKTGMKVVDTDTKIEKETGLSISEIFSNLGESYFRRLEKKVVEEVSNLKNHIIITGGGVVLDEENMKNLRKNGIIVYLHAEPDVIYSRIKNETQRPLLQVDDPKKKIKELMELRAPFYANHDIKIDTSSLSVDEVVEKILQLTRNRL
jgi:shikimate kinase